MTKEISDFYNENNCLTQAGALKALAYARKMEDTEAAHSFADDVLIDFIDDENIKKAFNKIDKWYA